jgi:uncharacterized membrane protein YdjX (TVP38/TMEM64 family)
MAKNGKNGKNGKLKKLLLAALYVGSAVAIYQSGASILEWLRDTDRIALVMLAAVLLSLFPVIPYPVAGGIIGAAFGPVLGGFMTWFGSTAASVLMFALVRYGFREWGAKLLHERPMLDKLTALFERHAFLAILLARLVPFVPSIIVNVYAALSRVSFPVYATASALGKIPAMLLFASAGSQMLDAPRQAAVTLLVYGGFLCVVILFYRMWLKRARDV